MEQFYLLRWTKHIPGRFFVPPRDEVVPVQGGQIGRIERGPKGVECFRYVDLENDPLQDIFVDIINACLDEQKSCFEVDFMHLDVRIPSAHKKIIAYAKGIADAREKRPEPKQTQVDSPEKETHGNQR